MFTIKYRTFNPVEGQPGVYAEVEQIHGPFHLVTKEYDEGGHVHVYAHRDDAAPGMSFSGRGPSIAGQPDADLWVMNERGATVAHYSL